jgi:hypothetical protein
MIDPEGGEGESYLCTWKKDAKGFRLVVKDRPELEGSGATFAEARSRLAERILLELGDGEAVFQFDKPLPKEVLPEEYSDPVIIWVGGNDTAVIRDPGGLFEGGICSLCGNPVGRRNGKAAGLSSPPRSKSDGAEAKHIGSLFSEAFIKVLEDSGNPPLEFREVQLEGKGRKKLFELAGRPIADLVAADGFPVQGVKCARCKRKVFHQMVGVDLIPFLAREDLPNPPLPAFFIRSRETLMLCMTGLAWRAIQGKPGTVNVVGIQIGIVPEAHVDRDPDLPIFKG